MGSIRCIGGCAAALLAAGASTALAGFSSVVDGDTASIGLYMYGENGGVLPINSLGSLSVKRGLVPVSIGENTNGQLLNGSRGNVLFCWDEAVGAQTNQVVAMFSSSDGQDLFPPGIVRNGEPFFGWAWRFGATDPVTWRNNVAAAPLYEAKVQLSSDGGQTFHSTVAFTASLPNPWNGKDLGSVQTGVGVNFIRVAYTIGQVPSPGALSIIGLCTMGVAHRRRR